MAYNGKTNWVNNDIVEAVDMNRIEQGITNNDLELNNHKNNISNPHQTTKSHVGLSNVDNTSDANKPVSIAQQEALDLAIDELGGQVLEIQDNAGFHNSIFRGKYLGSSVTAVQYAEISAGTFKDLYIGDYWTIGGINYRIAAFNYYYNTGYTAFTTNHAVIVPDTSLYTHVMNDTDITTGAYVGSKMYMSGLDNAKTTINNAFSGHVRSHKNYLHDAVTNGYASGGAWFDSEVELMTEANVYGTKHYCNATQGTSFADNIYVDKSQFPLFALNPQSINTRQSYWLRDIASSTNFAQVNHYGRSLLTNASLSLGVRPAFCIS